MGSLRGLAWAQAGMGVVLAFGGMTAALVLHSEPIFYGLLVAGVLWLLGYGQLRNRAGRTSEEIRRQPEGTIPWIPRAMAVAQFLSGFGVFFSEWSVLNCVANTILIIAILVYVLCCHGLEIHVDTGYWGRLLGIVAIGILWNVLTSLIRLFLWRLSG